MLELRKKLEIKLHNGYISIKLVSNVEASDKGMWDVQDLRRHVGGKPCFR